MTKYEKDEIRQLPNKYKPIGAWGYFGYNILFSIPVIGLICLIVFACSNSNINRRSYARSFFCVLILALIVVGILFAVGMGSGMFAALLEALQSAGGPNG
ncbi:MAG: hypothetical protein J1F68_01730 [Clostridiales bacterium]|nr:hypothetical protein [Clostridiales bacterium]